MGIGKADISGIPFTWIPSLASGDNHGWNELSPTSEFWSLTPSLQPTSLYSDHSHFHGSLLDSGSFTVHSDPIVRPHLCFPSEGHASHTISVEGASGSDQGTRRLSDLLDTREWSLSPNFASPHAASKSQLPLMGMGSDFSQAVLDATFASGNLPATNTEPNPQIILRTQPVPDSISGTFSPMEYHQASFATNLNHPSLHASDVVMSYPSAPGSTEYVTNVINREPPVVIYRPPEKKGSGHRRSKRACAINVEGLWVDKADLYHCAGHGNSTISVHECLWATSGGPCGMWIIGSRPRVGAHIRKWHPVQNHTKSTAECLWYGCAKRMLKDSINRHVVTSHFKEAFHCQGCDEEFSRQDVYNQHVEDSEMCRGTGAAIVYGTERRVIDAHQALHQGGAIRYAGRY